ncbi:MAG: peptide chain release factor N(5)-glutamine methyltransferase [Bacteroidota bacterium]
MTLKAARRSFIHHLIPKYGLGEAESIARLIFEDVFFPLNMLELSEAHLAQLQEIQRRLLQDEPVQYILGQADFFGLKLGVNPSVLIPRQETEELVALILERVGKAFEGKILDIGTGSGCIPIALKKHLPFSQVNACDVSEAALEVAKANAQKYGLDISFFHVDILNQSAWKALPEYDLIVSNPPYIPFQEAQLMPKQVKDFEPDLALFVENDDALVFYRHIAQFAQEKLSREGSIFFELNEYHARRVVHLLKLKGFRGIQLHLDLNGKERMLSAKWK